MTNFDREDEDLDGMEYIEPTTPESSTGAQPVKPPQCNNDN
jgi:hypothetical protein